MAVLEPEPGLGTFEPPAWDLIRTLPVVVARDWSRQLADLVRSCRILDDVVRWATSLCALSYFRRPEMGTMQFSHVANLPAKDMA